MLSIIIPHYHRRHAWFHQVLAAIAGCSLGIAAEANPLKIMPVGDSITFGAWNPFGVRSDVPGGYRKKLGELMAGGGHSFDYVGSRSDNPAAGMDPHHNGNPGWRTDQMLAALPDWMTADPDVILLKAGTNDVLQQKSVPEALRDLENLILEIVMPRPDRRLFITTLIPIQSDWGGIPQAVHTANANAYNAGLREIAARHRGEGRNIFLLDLDQLLVLTDPVPAKCFFQPGDGVHPGQAGYDQLGALWYSAMAANGGFIGTPASGFPVKRTNLIATTSSPTSVNLTWTDPAADETEQEIWCRDLSFGVWSKIAVVPADVTSHTAIGLRLADKSYRFSICAANSRGYSGWSNQATASAAGPPANLAAGKPTSALNEYGAGYSASKANDGSVGTLWASTGIALHWWQVDLQQPYVIEKLELVTRQDGANVEEQRRNFEIIASNDPTFATFTVLGGSGIGALALKSTLTIAPLEKSPFRYVRVRKTAVESFSIAEVRINGNPLVLPPAAPVGLVAEPVESGSVRLTWTAGSNNHSGFRIERRQDGSNGFFTITTTGALATEYTDPSPVEGSHYAYRVFSVNEAGESAPGTVGFTAVPDGSTYAGWTSGFPGLLALEESERQPGADPNQDGIPNLLAYAFGLDPLEVANPSLLPAIFPSGAAENPGFVFRFVRNRMATDLIYQIESSNLGTGESWTPVSHESATVSSIQGREDIEQVTVAVETQPLADRGFYRLRVTQPTDK